MPIYEFKCSKCDKFFEVIVMNAERDEKEVKCPDCGSVDFERVVSTTNYSMGGSASSKNAQPAKQTRNCSQGSCTTYTVPGVG